MKKLLLLSWLVLFSCSKDSEEEAALNPGDDIFTGTLVKQGICLNYVIQVNDTDFPQELIEKSWTDEFSNIEYKNVFALGSVCDFSEEIKEGSSFEFIIDNKKDNNCTVCSAFTPVPNKYISITVTNIN